MSRAQLAVGAFLLVLTLVVRLPGVDEPLWQDEVGAEHVVSKPTLRGALEQVVGHESTPPAFYLIARVTDRVVPSSAAESRARAVRFLSIAFSMACTFLTFVLACQLLSLWAATLAGLLASFSALLVVHGSEIRAYSLLALSCIAFAIFLQRAAEKPSRARLALLSGTVAVGSLTHYFFLFTLAAGGLWMLVSGQRRSVMRRAGVATAVGLVPLVVWTPLWFLQYEHGLFATAPRFSPARFLEVVASIFVPQAVVTDMSGAIRLVVTAVVLVPAALVCRRRDGRLCALCVLVPLLLVSALAWVTGQRIFDARNLIGIAPFAAVVRAWGCAALPWRRVSYAAGVLVCALIVSGFAYAQTNLGRTPYDRIAGELIAQGMTSDEPIFWFGSRGGIPPVAWYLNSYSSGGMWPRLADAESTDGTCTGLEVVARTRQGREWLAHHRAAVVVEVSLPSYGDVPLGGRRPDLTVARARWSPGILERPTKAAEWYLLHLADMSSPCLRS